MAGTFNVDSQQLYKHASNIKAITDQFGAIKGASGAISSDGAAFGLLCQWMAAILNKRHASQNSLYDLVEENLHLAAEAINATGQDYDTTDKTQHSRILQAGGIG